MIPIVVQNDDPLFFAIEYRDHGDPVKRQALLAQWQTFQRLDPATQKSYKIWVRPSNHQIEVTVDHLFPPNNQAGRYRIETFVPGKHATTRRAVFTIANLIHHNERGEVVVDDSLAIVDMNELFDVWVSLGDFYLDQSLHHTIGRVRQYDLTREDPRTEVSFGPVRWVPLDAFQGDRPSFDSPVGTPEERAGPFPSGRVAFGKYPIWAGEWLDVNPFLTWYTYGYHTGADLNLPGASGADKGKPIHAIGDGLVTYAGKAGTWGNIIVIEHPEALVTYPDGRIEKQRVYSRYGHVEDRILVRAGQTVSRGQNIGFIGLAEGATAGWHLHFDVSYTDILKKRPAHWPDLTAVRGPRSSSRLSDAYRNGQASVMRQVTSHYLDPLRFIRDNHLE